MTDHASLCFLSYNRPEFLKEAIETALQDPGYPCEVIVHDDGSDPMVQDAVATIGVTKSSLMLFNHPDHNEGVGRAINRSFSVSTGQYLLKIDQDLLFDPKWLRKAINVIEADPAVGMVGLFKYEVDPVDWRKMQLRQGDMSGARLDFDVPEYHYVEDFVSSAFMITRSTYETTGPLPEYSTAFAEDIEYKARLKNELGLKLALLDDDVCKNRGFGIGPSTVVEKDGAVHRINLGPWINE